MLISIIVPVFNAEPYLDKCIKSCLAQTFHDIEVIIVDDGSTDGSSDKCDSFKDLDNRVIVVHQSNAGASVSRNNGLNLAQGDYVMFVDSDDWIDYEMVDEMSKILLNNPDVQVIQTRVSGDMKHQERDGLYNSEEAIRCLFEGSWWGPVCKLIRRDLAKEVRFPSKTISEDYLFNYHLFKGLNSLFYLNRSFYHRTRRPDSLSNTKLSSRKFDEFYNVKAVSDLVSADCPHNQSLADVHLAGTCLKLLFSVFSNHAEGIYPHEMNDLLDCIKNKYFSFLKNRGIPIKERILLSTCFSRPSAKFTERLYHIIK